MIQQTIQKLTEMYLYGFAQGLKEQQESTQYAALSFEERIAMLVDKEHMKRQNSRLQARLKAARFPLAASVEDLDFSARRNLKRTEVLSLAQGAWVENSLNIIITGPTGAGKTYMACALGEKACRDGFSVMYQKASDLSASLLLARADGSYPKLLTKLCGIKIMVIDEWMRDPLPARTAREFLDLLDARYNKSSTIFIAQTPVASWHERFDDPTLADAILDRIVHNSHRINIEGDSMRKRNSKLKDTSEKTGELVASLRQ